MARAPSGFSGPPAMKRGSMGWRRTISSGGRQSSPPAFKHVDPDALASAKGLAGIANEGPSATYEAQQEAERAYPADSLPLSATLDSQQTFATNRIYGLGSAMAVLTFIIVMIVSFSYIRFVGGNIRGLAEE